MNPFVLARTRLRPSPFVLDLLLTTVTSLLTIVALIILTKIVAERLGPDGFGAFMLARRLVATADPVTTFAMAIALTRAVSLSNSPAERLRLFRGGAVLAVGPALLAFAVSAIAAPQLAAALFRDEAYGPLVLATGAMIVGYSFFTVLYAWYRAINRMTLANVWQTAAIAVGPVVAAWLVARPGGASAVMWGMAAVLLAAAIPVIAIAASPGDATGKLPTNEEWRQLIRYAAPRIPAGFAFAALLAVGPVLASRFGTLREVGFIAVGVALLRVVEGGTEAFGRVALPKVTQMFAAGGTQVLRDPVADIAAVVVHLGLFATCQLWIWSPHIVAFWLGAEYADAVPVVRWIVLGILPYLMFVTLRSVLDAIEERAVNTVNLAGALAVTVIVALVLGLTAQAVVGTAIATTLGLAVLGGLTFRAVYLRCEFSMAPAQLAAVLTINGLLLLAAAGAALFLSSINGPQQLVAIVAGEVVLLVAYVAALWQLRVRWLSELRRRLIRSAA